MARTAIATIESHCVGDQKMPHKLAEISLGGLNQQVEVLCEAPYYVKSN